MTEFPKFEMPDVATYEPNFTEPEGNLGAGVTIRGAQVLVGTGAEFLGKSIANGGWGKAALAVKIGGGLATATIGVVAESVITGKPPTVESILKSSVVAVASVLGGPVGGIIASTVIIAAENGLFDDIEDPFSNLDRKSVV